MVVALLIVVLYAALVWAVFFKFKWLKFSISWGVVSLYVGLHLLLVFMVGLRFMTPSSAQATVVQYSIQLVPRLPEPTLVTEVLVEQNMPVKKGQPLLRFDRRPYEYKVQQMQAALAQAKQNVQVLKANIQVAEQKIVKASAELEYALYQQKLATGLAGQGAGSVEDAQRAGAQVKIAQAALKEGQAQVEVDRLKYQAQIGGVNTEVAQAQANLELAIYYLQNTTLIAPEDGRIINLQVRPGMVAGIVRFGAIASFICDEGRYLLATYNQENLKYVKVGQPVEVALALYPGQTFKAHVDSVWKGSGVGQYLPSGNLPVFNPPGAEVPQGQFAVKILFDDPDQSLFPIGAQGIAAIYTEQGSFAFLRRIGIRSQSWFNWLYPLNI